MRICSKMLAGWLKISHINKWIHTISRSISLFEFDFVIMFGIHLQIDGEWIWFVQNCPVAIRQMCIFFAFFYFCSRSFHSFQYKHFHDVKPKKIFSTTMYAIYCRIACGFVASLLICKSIYFHSHDQLHVSGRHSRYRLCQWSLAVEREQKPQMRNVHVDEWFWNGKGLSMVSISTYIYDIVYALCAFDFLAISLMFMLVFSGTHTQCIHIFTVIGKSVQVDTTSEYRTIQNPELRCISLQTWKSLHMHTEDIEENCDDFGEILFSSNFCIRVDSYNSKKISFIHQWSWLKQTVSVLIVDW